MVHPHPALDQLPSVAGPPPPTVWTALAAEQQERVIRLLAHLACAVVVSPTVPAKEHPHAGSTHRP
jgi:hypothetical protein